MASRRQLIASRGGRFALVCALVVLLHVATILWIRWQLESMRLLRPMPPTMYTRLLQAQQPAQPVQLEATQAQVQPKPRRPTVTAIARPPSPVVQEVAPVGEAKPKEPEQPPEPERDPFRQSELAAAAAEGAESPSAGSAAPAPTVPGVTTAETWPSDTQLSYRLTGNFRGPIAGTARVQWQRDGARYQVRVEIDVQPFYNLTFTSQGDITPNGLSPRVYEESRRGNPRSVRLGDDTVTLTDGRVVARPPAVQDTASQFIELSHRFQMGQQALEVPGQVSLWLARPGGVDLWTYDIVERETLDSYVGPLDTFHLKPRPIANPRGNITAEIWFAPSLLYLPVRIRVNMGEAYVDLMVEKIEQAR